MTTWFATVKSDGVPTSPTAPTAADHDGLRLMSSRTHVEVPVASRERQIKLLLTSDGTTAKWMWADEVETMRYDDGSTVEQRLELETKWRRNAITSSEYRDAQVRLVTTPNWKGIDISPHPRHREAFTRYLEVWGATANRLGPREADRLASEARSRMLRPKVRTSSVQTVLHELSRVDLPGGVHLINPYLYNLPDDGRYPTWLVIAS